MLYVKNMVFLDGAIARLAPDLDILAEIANISMTFAQRHGDAARTRARHRADAWSSTSTASRPASASTQRRAPHLPRAAGPPRADPAAHARPLRRQSGRDPAVTRSARTRSPVGMPLGPHAPVRVAVVRTLQVGTVRLVIARCSVDYEGRLVGAPPRGRPPDHGEGRRLRGHPRRRRGVQAAELDERAQHARRPATSQWIVTNPKGERLTITLHEVLQRLVVGARRRSRAAEGRRRGPPPGAAGGQPALDRGRPHAGAPGVPDGDRARSTSCAGTPAATWSPSRSSGAATSTASSSWPATSSASTSTRRSARCAACSWPRSSSRRPGCSPRPAGFRWVEVDYDTLRGMRPHRPPAVLTPVWSPHRSSTTPAVTQNAGSGGGHEDHHDEPADAARSTRAP